MYLVFQIQNKSPIQSYKCMDVHKFHLKQLRSRKLNLLAHLTYLFRAFEVQFVFESAWALVNSFWYIKTLLIFLSPILTACWEKTTNDSASCSSVYVYVCVCVAFFLRTNFSFRPWEFDTESKVRTFWLSLTFRQKEIRLPQSWIQRFRLR